MQWDLYLCVFIRENIVSTRFIYHQYLRTELSETISVQWESGNFICVSLSKHLYQQDYHQLEVVRMVYIKINLVISIIYFFCLFPSLAIMTIVTTAKDENIKELI